MLFLSVQALNSDPRQVIRKFVQTAENRAEEASKEAKASKTEGMEDVDDLDMLYTPERLATINTVTWTGHSFRAPKS